MVVLSCVKFQVFFPAIITFSIFSRTMGIYFYCTKLYVAWRVKNGLKKFQSVLFTVTNEINYVNIIGKKTHIVSNIKHK